MLLYTVIPNFGIYLMYTYLVLSNFIVYMYVLDVRMIKEYELERIWKVSIEILFKSLPGGTQETLDSGEKSWKHQDS